MKLEEKLIVLRKQNGLSQLDLAEKLDVSRQAVSRWETGAAMPSTENLLCLQSIYDISLDALLNEEEEQLTRRNAQPESSREETSQEESPQENSAPEAPKWFRWRRLLALLMAANLLLLGTLIYLLYTGRQSDDILDIDELEREEVYVPPENRFPMTW